MGFVPYEAACQAGIKGGTDELSRDKGKVWWENAFPLPFGMTTGPFTMRSGQ